MPLIILSGLPTSGKSTRAAQLKEYLLERIGDLAQATPKTSQPYRLHLISDQSLSISRSVYDLSTLPAHARSSNALEKDARATIYAAVKRVLTERDIVILDGLNYIKGWRYQLYCEAKAVRTQSVVLQIGVSKQTAQAVNEARLRRLAQMTSGRETLVDETIPEKLLGATQPSDVPAVTLSENDSEEPYDATNWENLVFRYEEPNSMARWDSPLFALVWDDDEAQTRRVFDGIWQAIAGDGRSTVKPNRATVARTRETGGDYLYVLDRETQDIVNKILDAQQQGGSACGENVAVPREGSGVEQMSHLFVQLPGKKVGLPQLQRLRRSFVALNRGGIGLERVGDFAAVARMRESFVVYLNDSFDSEE